MSKIRRLPSIRSYNWDGMEKVPDKKEALNATVMASREQKSTIISVNIIQVIKKIARGNWGLGAGSLQGLVTKTFVW